MPVLSIIMPVYNAENTLHRVLDSIIKQRFHSFELIIVDDGSQDSSEAICREYCNKGKNIFYYKQFHKGPGAARNIGAELATGEFISFIDSDDWVEADYYGSLVVESRKIKADMVLSGYTREFWKGDCLTRRQVISHGRSEIYTTDQFAALMKNRFSYNFFIHTWNKIYRKDILKKNHILFDETLLLGEDVFYNIEYLKRTGRFVISPNTGYHYVSNDRVSLTKKWDPKILESNQIIYRCLKKYVQDSLNEANTPIIDGMYLKGCFLNLEKASSAISSKTQRKEILAKIANAEETSIALSAKQLPSLEFDLYLLLLKMNCPWLTWQMVNLRRAGKRVLGR